MILSEVESPLFMPERLHPPLHLYETPDQDLPGLTGFELLRGLDGLSQRLIERSAEAEMVTAVRGDSERRFKNEASLANWLATPDEERQMYPLLDRETGELAGIIWHHPKPFPLEGRYEHPPQDTFAIRLYPEYQRRGLALPFMKYCLADYTAVVAENGRAGNFHGIWLTTEHHRRSAYRLFRYFGYEEADRNDIETTMVLWPDKIRSIIETVANSTKEQTITP